MRKGNIMFKTTERNLHVDYFEKEEGGSVWIAKSSMEEEQHEICVTLEIDMEKMEIIGAKISFDRFPLPDCKKLEDYAKRLIGLKIDPTFSRNVMQIFMGPEGCPNVMTLLNIAVPGIMYYYYPHKIKRGEMTKEEFFGMLREKEKNACLAHTLLFGA